jgi:RNA polymerase sigma factor (sigma-70 family)
MVNEIMADYLECWTILRGRIKKRTRNRTYLFTDSRDYDEWVNSITNHGIADALKNLSLWDRNYPFHQFAYLRARSLIRADLKSESDYRAAARESVAKELPDQPEYGSNPIESLLNRAETRWALSQMSPDQVEALALRYEADLPVRDIARLMERTANAVSVLLHRGKSRLESLLRAPQTPSSLSPGPLPERPGGRQPRARSQLAGEDDGDPSAAPLETIVSRLRRQRSSL